MKVTINEEIKKILPSFNVIAYTMDVENKTTSEATTFIEQVVLENKDIYTLEQIIKESKILESRNGYKKLGKDTSAMGSADYKALSPQLKKTFVNIVQTNLEAFAKTIYTKTLLIWGKKDDQTPLYMAKRLEKYLKNCKLEFIENGGHFAFLEYPMQFYRHLKQFWEEE